MTTILRFGADPFPAVDQAPTRSLASSRRSIEMYTLHEALAREHQSRLEHEAHQRALIRQLASAHRWQSLERRAHAAHRRHARRAERAARRCAVAH